jgi:CO dehydrogenase maturation factor
MKLAVTGKGGVGKTTVSALMACALRNRGRRVFAVDADPDSNLAACMGYDDPGGIRPLVELKDLIKERTGAEPGTTGGMFQLNPFVADIPETYAVEIDGVHVLVAGAVKKGGRGCYCPENSLLRALVSHLLLDADTDLVLDMEAGIEHLSRGTVQNVDALVVVVNPGRRSVETALRIQRMARDVGLDRIIVVGNMIRSKSDEAFLQQALPGMDLGAFLPFDDSVRDAEISGRPVQAAGALVKNAVEAFVEHLTAHLARAASTEEKVKS